MTFCYMTAHFHIAVRTGGAVISSAFLLEQLGCSGFISPVWDSAGSLSPAEGRECHGAPCACQPGNFKGEMISAGALGN